MPDGREQGLGPAVRLLGVVDVTAGGTPLEIAGLRTTALLARLALAAGTVVSTDRIIDDVWGESAPTHAVNALQVRVRQLRRALGPSVITTHHPGYRLDLDPDDVDALLAQRLVAQARTQVETDPDDAERTLARALALWTGTPFEGLDEAPFVASARAHWTELRLSATYEVNRIRLHQGRGADVVPDLEPLAAQEPLHEPLHELLATAYAAQGRQAEALAVLRRIRQSLADQLGIDPGPALLELERRVLAQDADLVHAVPSSATVGASPPADPAPSHPPSLPGRRPPPRPLSAFLYRDTDLAAIDALLRDQRLVSVVGAGGVGKTRVALEVAARTSAESGWRFVPLDAVSDPDDVPSAVARALGLPGGAAPAALTAHLQGADVLLVLDNCEHLGDAPTALVQRILAECAGVRVLATSQSPLGLVGEAVWRLEPLPPDQAVSFFLTRAREQRPGFSPDGEELDAVREVCARLDGLPLALELAAARCHVLPVTELAQRLRDPLALPADTRTGRPERHRTLEATIRWSYEILFPDAQLAAQALTLFPDGAPPDGLTAVLSDVGVPAASVLEICTQLVDRSLVVLATDPDGGTRIRLPESVRAFASSRLRESGRLEDLERAMASWAVVVCGELAHELQTDQPAGLRRLAAGRATLDAALAQARRHRADEALQATSDLCWGWFVLGDAPAAAQRLDAALRAAQGVSPAQRSLALGRLALLYHRSGALAEAQRAARAALEVDGLDGDPVATARAGGILGLVLVESRAAEATEGIRLIEQAQTVLHEHGQRWDAAMCLLRLAFAAQLDGDHRRGSRFAEQALLAVEPLGDLWVEHAVWRLLGVFASMRADWPTALECFTQVLQLSRRLALRTDEAQVLEHLADVHLLRGAPRDAVPLLVEALHVAVEADDLALAATLRALLAATHRYLGEYDEAAAVLEPVARARHSGRPFDQPTALLVQEAALALAVAPRAASSRVMADRVLARARSENDLDQQVLVLDALTKALQGVAGDEASRLGLEADALAAQPRRRRRPLHRIDRLEPSNAAT